MTPRTITVGFVLHGMQVAGAEMLVLRLVKHLAGRIRAVVFCLDAVGTLADDLASEGVEVVGLERRPGRDLRVAWRLAGHIRRRRIEVLHAHQYTPFFYSALARLLCCPPPKLIFTEHGRHFPDIVSPLRRAVNRLVLGRLAEEINAVSAFSAASLARVDGFAGCRIKVIPNGVDPAMYARKEDRDLLRKRLGLEPARRYLVNVARFHPVKDHGTLLHAFRTVADARPDADLLLVGDGPLRPDFERLVRELGIDHRLRFLGVRSDVPDILRAADVFVLTSLSEAAPLTLLEAMAAGLPAVVTDVGGNPEILRHGREGFLVPRGDVPAGAAAILRLLDDPDRATAMGAAGVARVQEHYRMDQTIERYYSLYARLAGRA